MGRFNSGQRAFRRRPLNATSPVFLQCSEHAVEKAHRFRLEIPGIQRLMIQRDAVERDVQRSAVLSRLVSSSIVLGQRPSSYLCFYA